MPATYPIGFSAQLRQHLRALRKKRGLTQAQLGAQIGVSQVRIAEIEANPGLVSFDQLMQILSMLGVSISLSDPQEIPSKNMIADEAGRSLRSSQKMHRPAGGRGLDIDSSEEMRKPSSAAALGLSASEEVRKLASAAGLGLSASDEVRKLASAGGLGLSASEEVRKLLGLSASDEMRKLASAAGLGLGKLKKGSW